MIEINLLPGAKRSTRRGINFAPGAALANIGANFKDKFLVFGVVGAVIGIGAIAGMYVFQSRKEAAVITRETSAAADSARFAAVLSARSHAETTRDSVYQQVAIIKSIDDTRYTWPHLLEAINLAVPQYTWLVSVSQTSPITTTAAVNVDTTTAKTVAAKATRSTPAERRAHADSLFNGVASTTTFRIVGQTVDVQALTQFMKSLEASPFIRNVQLTRSDLVTADNKEVTEFQLEAQTEPPPAHLLQTVPLSIAVH